MLMIIISHQLMAVRAANRRQTIQPQENKLNPKDHVLREVVNSLRDIAIEFHGADQLRERLRSALDPLLTPQSVGVHDENARWAIEGAIAFGRMGVSKPPAEDHWLMEYWLIGRHLAPLGRLDASTAKLMAGQLDTPPQAAPEECWSVNKEEFNYSSLGELLDSNDDLEVGTIVWRGEGQVPAAGRLIDADDVLMTMGERASDIVGEFADGYPAATPVARAELDLMLGKWIEKWCPPSFYEVVSVKPYTLTAADLVSTGGDEE
nr:hypothetical protein [uncultured Janthinobacterium sp.]